MLSYETSARDLFSNLSHVIEKCSYFSVDSFGCSDIQGGHFSGIYRKVQLKPLKWAKVAKPSGEGEEEKPIEALMVLKYGGVLTHAGRKQV